MSIESQLEREEQFLEDQLFNGDISSEEYSYEMKELHRDYQGMAEEAAQDAYVNELYKWCL